MTPLYVLRQVDELLSTPDRWTRRTLARSAAGRPCSPIDPDAVRWCLAGAFQWVIPIPIMEEQHPRIAAARRVRIAAWSLGFGDGTLVDLNDQLKFADLKRIIARARRPLSPDLRAQWMAR